MLFYKDPVLFSGTLRMNLDPFNEYEEQKIWEVLENTHLKNFVSNLERKLKFKCLNGGDNLRYFKNKKNSKIKFYFIYI